jgi:hypothetical protein
MLTPTLMKTEKIDKKTLWGILSIEAESHDCEAQAEHMAGLLRDAGATVTRDECGNVLAIRGDPATSPVPCIAAHLDTVHAITGEGILPVEVRGSVLGVLPQSLEQCGIGGDDKCGLYAALHCLRALPACRVALLVDEEVGCLGASRVDLAFFANAAFILEADRRGGADFVTAIAGTPLGSAAWLETVAPLYKARGFRAVAGAMTDVQELRDRGVGVSVANMSAGYHTPHTDRETIDLRELANTVSLMLDICRGMGGTRWEYTPPRYVAPPAVPAKGKSKGRGEYWTDVEREYVQWWQRRNRPRQWAVYLPGEHIPCGHVEADNYADALDAAGWEYGPDCLIEAPDR